MAREIQLDGTETYVLKSLGIGSGDTDGATLMERCPDLDLADLTSTLKGLMTMGYVDADDESFHNKELFEKTHFRVNSGWAKDLREALDPTPQTKSKRVRRE